MNKSLIIGLLMCFPFTFMGQEKTEGNEVLYKNTISVSVGLKSNPYSINYERFFRLKNENFYFTGSVGIGYYYHFSVPVYAHFGYGKKVAVEAFFGTSIIIDPEYSSKALRDDYLNNPDYSFGAEPTFPVEPHLVGGAGVRFNLSQRLYLKTEAALSYSRTPSYKEFPKWKYEYSFLFGEVSFGYRF
ncbi:hypothetical protein KFE98_02555 [bacterium SCSIO 12741]|nr:hypothetical protein KFE98_02555 [bacterium SCSIO 12741]